MQWEFVQRLTGLVEANLSNENFGPDELAKEAGMSHSNLNRKLKSITNKNASHFIREIRLKKAKELLENEELTAAEISFRVGFGSPTYFNKCYHEYFGVAPGEMRNHNSSEQKQEQEVQSISKSVLNSKKKIAKKQYIIVFGIIIIVIIGTLLKDQFSKFIFQDKFEKSIAVLPFEFLGKETNKEYLAERMMNDIISQLSKISQLRVIPNTTVKKYRNVQKAAKEIGRELRVANILYGSFEMEESNYKVVVQLIDAENEKIKWSEVFENNLNIENISRVETEIALKIADELRAQLTPEERKQIIAKPTANLLAGDYFQMGEEAGKDIPKARAFFKKAIEADSTYVMAYIRLCEIYVYLNFHKTYLQKTHMDSVLIFADKALQFDKKNPYAYFHKSFYYYVHGQPEEALKLANKAIELKPDYEWAYKMKSDIYRDCIFDFVGLLSNLYNDRKNRNAWYRKWIIFSISTELVETGLIEEGLKLNKDLVVWGNDTSVYTGLCHQIEYAKGNYEKGWSFVKEAKVGLEDCEKCRYCVLTGNMDEALSIADTMAFYFKDYDWAFDKPKWIGYVYWQKGKKEEAKHYFELQIKNDLECIRLRRWYSVGKYAHYDLAEVYAFLGEKENAYKYLDEFSEKRAIYLSELNFLKNDPFFHQIKDEPRFKAIVAKMETKYLVEHKKARKWFDENSPD